MPSSASHIVYVDESGDHGLRSIDPAYPVFVLALCIFRIEEYVTTVVPAIERMKFEFFGHDMIVLHERDIRKAIPPFDALLNPDVRRSFVERCSEVIESSPFTIVACVIDKTALRSETSALPANPYHLALEACLRRVHDVIVSDGGAQSVRIVFEGRGRREDAELRREFARITSCTEWSNRRTRLLAVCASKQANSSGLQLADLVARPIGLKVLRPDQANRAWDVIAGKFSGLKEGSSSQSGSKVLL